MPISLSSMLGRQLRLVALLLDLRKGTPALAAWWRIPAPGWSEMTMPTSASSSPRSMASRIALKFDPLPDPQNSKSQFTHRERDDDSPSETVKILEFRFFANRSKPLLMSLEKYLSERGKAVDAALNRALPKATVKPATIHKAMRYSLFAGGKRMRPILAVAAAEACGGKIEAALPAACAVECVHTYSLIHDDLPCMDDDDMRRGRAHLAQGLRRSIAVLAGDALGNPGLRNSRPRQETSRYKTRDLILELSHAAGSLKLIAGQVADLEGEGKNPPARNSASSTSARPPR